MGDILQAVLNVVASFGALFTGGRRYDGPPSMIEGGAAEKGSLIAVILIIAAVAAAAYWFMTRAAGRLAALGNA